MPKMLGRQTVKRQKPKEIDECAGIEYAEHMMLVIPCRTGKPDRIKPRYVVKFYPETEIVWKSRWVCEQCGMPFHNRKSWAKHAGTISNIAGNCPGTFLGDAEK